MPVPLSQAERAPAQLVLYTQEKGRVVQGGAGSTSPLMDDGTSLLSCRWVTVTNVRAVLLKINPGIVFGGGGRGVWERSRD